MKIFRPLRLMVLALLVSLIPVSSFAGVFVSVGFAPPILPVYDQPPCPEPGLMWTPGYWAYGEDGYYWVPGTWVPVPYEGALWTPPYWGWEGGLYMFHPGYWGRHVGYYGGVNYGFGYMGIGFVGGMWRGHDFFYNTAVMRVDEGRIHGTYMDRESVDRYTVARDSRVAYSGGPGGIRHNASAEERYAERDQHMEATAFQHSHESVAMSDRSSYVRNNGGHPSNLAVQRPWGTPNRMEQDQGRGNYNPSNKGNADTRNLNNNSHNDHANGDQHNFNNSHSNNANANNPYSNSHSNTGNDQHRPAPEFRQKPEQPRPVPQVQPQSGSPQKGQGQSGGGHSGDHGNDHGNDHKDHQH